VSQATHLDALAQKAARLRRCIERAREEKQLAQDFTIDFSRQDAAILNIQRACDLAIDMANMVISHERWGLPRSAKEVFALLQERRVIAAELSQDLQNMVGFRNLSVHQYENLDMNIVEQVISEKLNALLQFSGLVLRLTQTRPQNQPGT
jgi:uncharacterized protein YutE (UPF0331/DUF86 family)